MTAPLGLHATSDVHSGCARSLSFAESWTRALDASRRKRDGMIGRDGNGGGRGSEERIERKRMRGRGEQKSSRGETREERERKRERERETISDVYRPYVRRWNETRERSCSWIRLVVVGRRNRQERAAPGSTSRRRRHAASLCARLRPGTSHVNVVWVFTTAHTNACTLWMHGGYIKSGWIYRGDREGRLLITRRVDQPLSLRLSLPPFCLYLSPSAKLPLLVFPANTISLSLYLIAILSILSLFLFHPYCPCFLRHLLLLSRLFHPFCSYQDQSIPFCYSLIYSVCLSCSPPPHGYHPFFSRKSFPLYLSLSPSIIYIFISFSL
ncbi:hypothetical protein ACFW04_003170 [Cataglyphis niger]